MNKKDAFRIIHNCCQIYQCNLESNNFLFIYKYKSGEPYNYFEATFMKYNYHHLTGTVLNKSIVASPADFYNACINNQLDFNSFEMRSDGTTDLKLQVLPSLMQIHTCAKMIGDYNGSRVVLKTEKIIGGVKGCLGFTRQGTIFVPNTIMRYDIRNSVAHPYGNIDAIFSKRIGSTKYYHLRYLSKRMNNIVSFFSDNIENLIDRNNIIYCFSAAKPGSSIYD